jgi:glucokinase
MADHSYVIGFDMGGTKMLATVLDDTFSPVGRAKTRTPAGADSDGVFAAIVETVNGAVEDAGISRNEVRAIGIAVPGPLDLAAGRVIEMPNVGMRDFPLRDRLREAVSLPVVLENDVNAGTYGEYVAGAARGHRNVIGVFPGTGVGGGIIINGKLYRGRLGRAGEIGHITVQVNGPLCGCGKYGCLEAVASKTAIAKDLVLLAATGSAPTVFERVGTDFSAIKSGVIRKAIDAGEKAVIRVVDRAAWFLGVGLGTCVEIFDPDVIVIGGGLVEKLGEAYLSTVDASFRENTMVPTDVPLLAASLGDDSVIIGAAALALEALDE